MSFSAGSIMARASSGSRSSINSVEPLMSANSAVTVLRSPSGSSAIEVGDGAVEPAIGIVGPLLVAINAGPQLPQTRWASGFSDPHLVQRIGYLDFEPF